MVNMRKFGGLDTQKSRQINQAMVLRIIKDFAPISQVGIVKKLGMAASTISDIVDDLKNRKLVKIVGERKNNSKVGRRPVLLAINPDGGRVLGISVTVKLLSAIVMDLEANPIEYLCFRKRNEVNCYSIVEDILKVVKKNKA